jgi:hypothetical protein
MLRGLHVPKSSKITRSDETGRRAVEIEAVKFSSISQSLFD